MNKGLPNNIDAEKALIGSLFWSKSALQKGCEDVEKEYFYLDSNAKIFEVIKSTPQSINRSASSLLSQV